MVLGNIVDTTTQAFIKNPIENLFEQFKEKMLVGAPYLFATGFIIMGAVVIFRRLGR
tara:strand:- start:183 stop:353 length:171 start_codon:yes stop_codon:yes gene_type:complete